MIKKVLLGTLMMGISLTSLNAYSKKCFYKRITYMNSFDKNARLTKNQFLQFLLTQKCGINIQIEDKQAEKILNTKMPYVNFQKTLISQTLKYLLGNKVFYNLDNNGILHVSYYETRTYNLDFVNSSKTGSNKVDSTNSDIDSQYKFEFWNKILDNVNTILKNINPTSKPAVLDKEAGVLTVTGNKKQIERIDKYIKKIMNRLTRQVLIDVKIYSVELNKNHSTGINWQKLTLSLDGITNLTTRNLFGSTSIFKQNQFNINGFINFLHQYGKVITISNPKIVTLNNQKAMLNVGKTINYQIENVTTDSNGNIVKSYTPGNVFVGLTLDITPQISNDDYITLNIAPELSNLVDPTQLEAIANGTRNFPPDTQTKNLLSAVKLKDNQTLVLGGIITQDTSINKTGVPVLEDIPIIGNAFKGSTTTKSKSELIFVITPHIIDLKKNTNIKNYIHAPEKEIKYHYIKLK